AVGVVIDGCPAGISLSEEDIQHDLDRRRPGVSSVSTSRNEADKAEILSGIFEGKTTGTPISILVKNNGQHSNDYSNIRELFRPGHADYTYQAKYGLRDYRGGGRSSGRETIGRVAAGAVAKKILERAGIKIIGYTKQIGNIEISSFDADAIDSNDVRSPDPKAAKEMITLIEAAKRDGDSIGGVVEVVAKGVPAGLGEPVFDKLDADIAKALMSIGAVKGVEIGDGFASATRRGSENNDHIVSNKDKISFSTNHAGGILGGISNGDDIVARIAVKPTASISKPQPTVDLRGKQQEIRTEGRHDPSICPRIVPVAEAMLALVLADHLLRNRSSKV
ncbi:MAG: chorismate synthase, partial [Nitrospinae bacterium]|nr:chorismate synthase [Nitrospinota bacterium]